MEENKPTGKKIYLRQFLIAFASFDIIHLVCATVLLVFAYTAKPIETGEAAECFVEIVFALLLISFISAMSNHHKYVDRPQITFTLGCLTASASLFVPLSIEMPLIIEGDWKGDAVTVLVLLAICIALSFLAFTLFFISLRFVGRKRIWIGLVIAALLCMSALAPVEFALEMQSGVKGPELVFHLIKTLAPLVFAPTGILLVARPESRNDFFRDLK